MNPGDKQLQASNSNATGSVAREEGMWAAELWLAEAAHTGDVMVCGSGFL